MVTGACETEISDLVTLEVYENVTIDLQPTAVHTCEGSTANFNIAASGSITGTSGGRRSGSCEWNRYFSANSPNLTITNLGTTNAGGYTCVVTGECGMSDFKHCGLVVDEAIVIIVNPATRNFVRLTM